jgi:hypothetical protein
MIKSICFLLGLAAGSLLPAATLTSATLKDFGEPTVLDRALEPVGLYHLEIESQIVPALSIDDADRVHAGQTWTAIVSPLADWTEAYHPSSQLAYSAAAWLYTQDGGRAASRVDIQHAAWALFDLNMPLDQAALGWEFAALVHGASLNVSQFFLLSSPPGAPRTQEFVFEAPSGLVAAPEPNGLLPVGLLCISLSVALGWVRRSRSRKRRARNLGLGAQQHS